MYEAAEALESQLNVDALVVQATCLRDLTCNETDQRELVAILGIGAENQDANQTKPKYENVWIVFFGADRSLDSAKFEFQSANTLGYDLACLRSALMGPNRTIYQERVSGSS